MEAFQPTNNIRENAINADQTYGINRYIKTQPELQGFLRNTTQEAVQTITPNPLSTRDTYQGLRNEFTSLRNTSQAYTPTTTRQRGIAVYRENNVLFNPHTQATGNTYEMFPENTQRYNAAEGLLQNTVTEQPLIAVPENPGTVLINRAIQEYEKINTPSTTALLQRESDMYLKNLQAVPLGAQMLETEPIINQPEIMTQQSINSLRSPGIFQYDIMNAAATGNEEALNSTADLYLKSNPRLQFEAQLFI